MWAEWLRRLYSLSNCLVKQEPHCASRAEDLPPADTLGRDVTCAIGADGRQLLLSAHWAAKHACGVQLPIGVMNVSIGSICFLWLFVREGRR